MGRCYFTRILNRNMNGVIREQKVTGANAVSRNTRLNGYLGRI